MIIRCARQNFAVKFQAIAVKSAKSLIPFHTYEVQNAVVFGSTNIFVG